MSATAPVLLDNTIREYAWGSTTSLAELMGIAPTGRPQAELWMGAHPNAPSRLHPGGAGLDSWIAFDPDGTLGHAVVDRFGPVLPFLFKVLAAARPLSIQVHPDLEQARAGCAREDAAGIARDAPHRSYRDANHKPELVCALTPFEALCGWRPISEIRRLFDALEMDELAAPLASEDPETAITSTLKVALGTPRPSPLAGAVARACRDRPVPPAWAKATDWGVRLGEAYPGDPGIVVALMLNHLVLQPGQALFLGAGRPHAYLHGTAVELMANSDNVIRGGLTPKHVDVDELLRIVDRRSGPVTPLEARPIGPGRFAYDAPAAEFALERLEPRSQPVAVARSGGPELVLCTHGRARLLLDGAEALVLGPGASAFVPHASPGFTLEGPATVFRATVGDRGPTPA